MCYGPYTVTREPDTSLEAPTGLPQRLPAPGDPDFGLGPRYHLLFGRRVGRCAYLANLERLDAIERVRLRIEAESAARRTQPYFDEIAERCQRQPRMPMRGGLDTFLSVLRRVSAFCHGQVAIDHDAAIADNGMGC